ncbi:hypothetical protein RHSIM_Rhsim13G0037400 [Rhododendron simsii]|uniref:Uncharacterized protein n=1 Tax=Rhododendron simsii TaxID=118357 RepID=A0A834G071_RHOSS|nr:hypothetical protein RHSIM_Rhsim13G0037400 [Rhododendron simsii]
MTLRTSVNSPLFNKLKARTVMESGHRYDVILGFIEGRLGNFDWAALVARLLDSFSSRVGNGPNWKIIVAIAAPPAATVAPHGATWPLLAHNWRRRRDREAKERSRERVVWGGFGDWEGGELNGFWEKRRRRVRWSGEESGFEREW